MSDEVQKFWITYKDPGSPTPGEPIKTQSWDSSTDRDVWANRLRKQGKTVWLWESRNTEKLEPLVDEKQFIRDAPLLTVWSPFKASTNRVLYVKTGPEAITRLAREELPKVYTIDTLSRATTDVRDWNVVVTT